MTKAIILLTSLLTAISFYSESQSIIYVNHNASGSNDGSNWTNAFTSLQSAINASSVNDSIFVAKGTYYPSSIAGGTANNRDKTFLLKSGVKIIGAFTGTELSINDRSTDSLDLHVTNETILSGDFGTVNDSSDNAFHVITAINVSDQTSLNGFTISNGNANDSSKNVINTTGIDRNFGGGLILFNADLELSNCIVSNNLALSGGGGMNNVNGSEPQISHSIFTENIIWGQNPNQFGGGAMRNSNSSPSMNFCHFWSNKAFDIQGGGAIRNESNSGGTITNSFFSNNVMDNGDGGGAIYNLFSNPIIDSVLFANNSTANQGAGMYNDNSKPVISNSEFSMNYAGQGGAAMENDGGSDLTLFNVDFLFNWTPDNGGAIQNWKSSPIIDHCYFLSNASSQGDGGALYNYNDCSPKISNSIFDLNNAAGNGGAIYNRRNCNPILTNLLITRNSVGRYGGGAYTVSSNGSPCSPIATNLTITENQADSGGGGLFDDGLGNPKLRNSIVHGNGSSIGEDEIDAPASSAATSLFRVIIGNDFYTNGLTPPSTFTSNVFVDPIANPGKEFHLAASSPAQNKGDSTFFNVSQTPDLSSIIYDLRNAKRIMGINIDLGVYEICSDTIQLNPHIQVSPDTIVFPFTTVTFTVTHSGGGSQPIYVWYKNGIPFSNNGPSYTGNAGVDFSDNDVFNVVLVTSDGCDTPDSASSNNVRIKFFVGVNSKENKQETFSVFPNPFNDNLWIEKSFDSKNDYLLLITDMLGKELFSEKIKDNNRHEINTSNLQNTGIYILRIVENDQIVYYQKLLKR